MNTAKTSTSTLEDRYQHLLQTILAARACDLDDLIGEIWEANGEARLTDIEAHHLDAAVRARRAVLAERRRAAARDHHLALRQPFNGMHQLGQIERDVARRASIRDNRQKVFGMGRPKPMAPRIKRKLIKRARQMTVPTEPGKHYGKLTPKFVAVYEALLFEFHNAITGFCFPGYERIAAAANCARSTVHLALIALEEAGLLSWDHRLKRVYERVVDLFGCGAKGQRSQVWRTSNGYTFFFEDDEPAADVKSSKSELPSGTTNQLLKNITSMPDQVEPALGAALRRLEAALKR